MGTVGNSIRGLTATAIGSGVAIAKTLNNKSTATPEEQVNVEGIGNQYDNTINETFKDVYKTTRLKDRNIFMQQFTQANNLAQQRQEFIKTQIQAYNQRIVSVGGINTPKGKAIQKMLETQVINPVVQQTRKDLTEFRKKKEDK